MEIVLISWVLDASDSNFALEWHRLTKTRLDLSALYIPCVPKMLNVLQQRTLHYNYRLKLTF